MATPMVREARRIFPDDYIAVFARDWVAPVYQYVDGINEIINFSRSQRKNFASRQQLIQQLRKSNFDLAFLLPDSFSTAWLLYWSGIQERIGYAGQFRTWMLTNRLPLKPSRLLHRSDKYISMLHQFDSDLKFGETPALDIPENPENFPTGWNTKKVHIGINPFSVATSRRWPHEYWQQLIDLIHDPRIQFVMFGGPGDKTTAEKIISGTNTEILNLTGKTSLRESIQLISGCNLFISNDSGPMHIADAAGVPTLGFWGAGDTRETGLRSDRSKNLNANVYCSPCRKNECINKKEPLICLKSLPPDLVADEIRYFLEHQKFRD